MDKLLIRIINIKKANINMSISNAKYTNIFVFTLIIRWKLWSYSEWLQTVIVNIKDKSI